MPPELCKTDACTSQVLGSIADGFSCGDRIRYLHESSGLSEEEACVQVAVLEFPDVCGACAPYSFHHHQESFGCECPPGLHLTVDGNRDADSTDRFNCGGDAGRKDMKCQPPSARGGGVRCCGDHGLPPISVCTENCERVDFPTAVKRCLENGRRLCSAAEVAAGQGTSTGCLYDYARIWVSDVCILPPNPSPPPPPPPLPSPPPPLLDQVRPRLCHLNPNHPLCVFPKPPPWWSGKINPPPPPPTEITMHAPAEMSLSYQAPPPRTGMSFSYQAAPPEPPEPPGGFSLPGGVAPSRGEGVERAAELAQGTFFMVGLVAAAIGVMAFTYIVYLLFGNPFNPRLDASEECVAGAKAESSTRKPPPKAGDGFLSRRRFTRLLDFSHQANAPSAATAASADSEAPLADQQRNDADRSEHSSSPECITKSSGLKVSTPGRRSGFSKLSPPTDEIELVPEYDASGAASSLLPPPEPPLPPDDDAPPPQASSAALAVEPQATTALLAEGSPCPPAFAQDAAFNRLAQGLTDGIGAGASRSRCSRPSSGRASSQGKQGEVADADDEGIDL